MRCKTCDYRLWGSKGRTCPECGTHFLPSQFEFVPNSVRFCCPNCGQDYYGTGESGHLVPPAFDCVRCGRHVHMDEMTLFPTTGVEEEQTEIERMPWLDREHLGFFRRWMRTIYMGMFSPVRLMELTPPDSSLGRAWFFAALTGFVGSLGTSFLAFFPMLLMFGGGSLRGMGVAEGFILTGWLFGPSILIALWGVAAHTVLAVTGRHEFGARRTYQAICYGAAPSIMTVVPCLGFYLIPVAWIWWTISAILMIRQGQRVGGGRAAAAVLSFPAILAAGLACFIIFAVIPGIQSARRASSGFSQQGNLVLIATDLSNYARQQGGRPPGHASELIPSGVVSASMFIQSSGLSLADVPLAGTNLQRFAASPPSVQRTIAQAAAGALPAKVVAHRLGDFVFTYHGINLNNPDPGLWIVVLAPEASQAPPGLGVHVALADGTTTRLLASRFADALASQNALRASKALGPLPDPRTVTHTQPALAP